MGIGVLVGKSHLPFGQAVMADRQIYTQQQEDRMMMVIQAAPANQPYSGTRRT
jgi:hypothetical protein